MADYTRFKLRGDIKADWLNANPILALNEPALETDTKRFKIGDGVSTYSALPYGRNTNEYASLYNVSMLFPLSSGFYTHETAISAIPTAERIKGLIISYETASGIWYTEQYTGADVSGWATLANWSKVPGAIDFSEMETSLGEKVSKSGNESIEGVKTFSESPIIPTPTTNLQAATKGYVDAANAQVESDLGEIEQEQIQGGVYDVSSHNDGAVFDSLSSLLGSANLSTLIPTPVRRGGMSIRFIQGSVSNSDNKYVQYRLTADEFTIDVSKWAISGDDVLQDDAEFVKVLIDKKKSLIEGYLKDGGKIIYIAVAIKNKLVCDDFECDAYWDKIKEQINNGIVIGEDIVISDVLKVDNLNEQCIGAVIDKNGNVISFIDIYKKHHFDSVDVNKEVSALDIIANGDTKLSNLEIKGTIASNRKNGQKLVGCLYFDGWSANGKAWRTSEREFLEGGFVNMGSESDLWFSDSFVLQGKENYPDWREYVKVNFGAYPVGDCSLAMYFPDKVPQTYSKLRTYRDDNDRLKAVLDEYGNPVYDVVPCPAYNVGSRETMWGWRRGNDDVQGDYTIEDEIEMASANGIDYFVFCFYYASNIGYPVENLAISDSDTDIFNLTDEQEIEGVLRAHPQNAALYSFLEAPNNWKMNFSVIIFPESYQMLTTERAHTALNYINKNFVSKDNFLRLNGRPTICLYQNAPNKNQMLHIGDSSLYVNGNIGPNIDGVFWYGGARVLNDSTTPYTYTQMVDSNYVNLLKAIRRFRFENMMYACTVGWDGRSRDMAIRNHYVLKGTEEEIYNHLISTMKLANKYQQGDKAILIYAWNEYGEGGWIPPTKSEITTEQTPYHAYIEGGVQKYYDTYKLKAIKRAKDMWLNL